VTYGSSNKKQAYKTDRIIIFKCISCLSFQGTTIIMHQINRTKNVQITCADLNKILGFGFSIIKKPYLDPHFQGLKQDVSFPFSIFNLHNQKTNECVADEFEQIT
jgi:hypothetical protein